MARSPTATLGHNSATLPEPKVYQRGMALIALQDEEAKKMRERHKRQRTRMIEGQGVAIEDAKRMFAMKDAPVSDVVRFVQRTAHALGALIGKKIQVDLFAADEEKLAAIRFKGMMAGIEGKDHVPPPTLDSVEKQAWMEGWHDGTDARKATATDMAQEFVDGEEGDHTEAALQDRAAARVGVQAAKDFRDDNMPAMPDWAGMGGDHTKWKVSETAMFVAWFSSLPRESNNLPLIPDGLPLGVRNAFVDYKNRLAAKPADDGATLDGGVKERQGVGGPLQTLKPEDVKRLDLTPIDFNAESWDEVTVENYRGEANLDDYHLVVVRDGDKVNVLKDVVGAPPAEEEGTERFEAPQSELDAQKPRMAVVAGRDVDPAPEPTKPKPVRQKKMVDKESQSDRAARLRREAKVK